MLGGAIAGTSIVMHMCAHRCLKDDVNRSFSPNGPPLGDLLFGAQGNPRAAPLPAEREAKLSDSHTTIINVLGIVAVLIVNVTYVGYITPPGGSHPSWETCNYWPYIAFFVLNGLAFLFSLCAVCVVAFLPYVLDGSGTRWDLSVIRWGIIHLALGIFWLLLAFSAAGLTSASFKEPDYTCSFVPCPKGGIYCTRATFANVTRTLNKFEGRCFKVTNITTGAQLRASTTPLEKIGYNGSSIQRTTTNVTFDSSLDNTVCYLGGVEVNSFAGLGDVNFQPSNTLCMVDKPSATLTDDITRLGQYVTENAKAVWRVRYNVTYIQQGIATKVAQELVVVPSLLDMDACNAMQPGQFSFVTHDETIYAVNVNASSAPSIGKFDWGTNQSGTVAGQGFLIHDELSYRCRLREGDRPGSATWCRYDTRISIAGKTLYNADATTRCFTGEDCPGYAVRLDGSYVKRGTLADFAADSNHIGLGENATQIAVAIVVFAILGVALAVNIGTLVLLYLRNRPVRVAPPGPLVE